MKVRQYTMTKRIRVQLIKKYNELICNHCNKDILVNQICITNNSNKHHRKRYHYICAKRVNII